ncbi:twitching motility protein PilT [Bacteroidia bacterium]|nr:twitching motility protein PilT [Bacteroidia bacterium]
MKLLIDTQSFIWFIEDDAKLPSGIYATMNDATNSLVVSIASLWEMTIKMSLNKLKLSGNIETMISKAVIAGFEILPIKSAHLMELSKLDFLHKDPFDRLIIAQAISENISLISSDSVFKLYPVQWIW